MGSGFKLALTHSESLTFSVNQMHVIVESGIFCISARDLQAGAIFHLLVRTDLKPVCELQRIALA